MAPLDWGLGHTTRCVPLIRFLSDLGHEVLLAGQEDQLSYYRQEFPDLRQLYLEGYNVSYARSGKGFAWKIGCQLPRLAASVRREHRWLLRTVRREKIDGIISDNRYGLYHPDIPSVIITHQLQVSTGMGEKADRMLRQLHYRFLQRFRACWVADVPGSPNLSGRLAHPDRFPDMPLSYLGWLTHLRPHASATQAPAHKLLVLLSGPEPQRGLLSELLWRQLERMDVPACFVEGSLQAPERKGRDGLEWYGRVGSAALGQLIAGAEHIICRSGYSTVMDLAACGKKGIFIPTPGQTEQELLGRHLAARGMGLSYAQEGFDLARALEAAARLHNDMPPLPDAHEAYRPVLEQWLAQL